MEKDSHIGSRARDGAAWCEHLLMQFQAIFEPRSRAPVIQRHGARRGLALAAVGLFGPRRVRANWAVDRTWKPHSAERTATIV